MSQAATSPTVPRAHKEVEMIPKVEWENECSEARRTVEATSVVLNGMLLAFICIVSLVVVFATSDGRWFALPAAYGAAVLLYASFHAGSLRKEAPLAVTACMLGVLALNIAGVFR